MQPTSGADRYTQRVPSLVYSAYKFRFNAILGFPPSDSTELLKEHYSLLERRS